MKTIQGLRKRTAGIAYVRDGQKVDDFGPLRVGDVATSFHENGASISIRVDALQKEGTFLGTVRRVEREVPGLKVRELIVNNMDFVFVVVRGDNAAAAMYE